MNKLLIGWAALLGVASAVMVAIANLVAKHNDADSIEQRRAAATARANAEMIERINEEARRRANAEMIERNINEEARRRANAEMIERNINEEARRRVGCAGPSAAQLFAGAPRNPGAPPDMNYWLAQKYAILGKQAGCR
jgi:hypothetical protein